MPLDCKAKEFILGSLKQSVSDLQKSRFGKLKQIVPHLITIGELYPDGTWTNELNMIAFTIAGTGGTMESEFRHMDIEQKGNFIKIYSESLSSLYNAIEEEDISKIDSLLKSLVTVFFKELSI